MRKKVRLLIFLLIIELIIPGNMWSAQNVIDADKTTTGYNKIEISGELKIWHKVTLTFEGPETSESEEYNPFMGYRLNVLFTHSESHRTMNIPGYYAADGMAGETSASSGNKWRVHFAPPESGQWMFRVDFRKGAWVAISDRMDSGESAGYMDGLEGSINVDASDKSGNDNRAKGILLYDGTRYLKFAETGKPLLKVGPDAPENFLAYSDFDGTFHEDGYGDRLVKTWEAHLRDWNEGDPTWQNGKGKSIIGAVNYLAYKGLNSFSFLTLNIGGDDKNVFPFIDYHTYDRYDCSKLDQWEMVFEHADQRGMFLHFKLAEVENQGLLDHGAIGGNTKLYYRELMARFGHHLAMNWNVGEEFGDWEKSHKTIPLCSIQRRAAAEYIYSHDPYKHHLVVHNGRSFDDILGPESSYTGVSLQTWKPDFSMVHSQALKWIRGSEEAGKQWAVSVDEPGDAENALITDAEDPGHRDARVNGLWGAFMAGAWGTEWYFGYAHENSDLTCQDYRSRDLFWDQCKYLLDFFEGACIPVTKTENSDGLVQKGDYCLAIPHELYIVFLRSGKGTINLADVSGTFGMKWFDPRNGGVLQEGSIDTIEGGKIREIRGAPTEPDEDWVVLLRKE